MASQLVLAFAFGLMLLLLGAVYGAVDERERALYCLGIILIVGGPVLGATMIVSQLVGTLLATLGAIGVAASGLVLLRDPRASGH